MVSQYPITDENSSAPIAHHSDTDGFPMTPVRSKMRIAFVGPLACTFSEPVLKKVQVPCEAVLMDEAGVVAEMASVDVVVTLVFSKAMGEAARRLRLVQVPGAGLDRIDPAAIPSETVVANVYGHETGIAEYVIGAMLTLSREFLKVDRAMRRGEWLSSWAVGVDAPPLRRELAGKTLGIIGYGHIGQAVAKRAQAFDMTVLATRRSVQDTDPYATVRPPSFLNEMLGLSDFVVVTTPLTEETRGLIGRTQFGLMKAHTILVNIARGAVVEEEALYSALKERRIGGAALDVWYNYPSEPGLTRPSKYPFHELDNVLMTPHVSGATDGTLEARAKLVADNIERVAKGLAPLNKVQV